VKREIGRVCDQRKVCHPADPESRNSLIIITTTIIIIIITIVVVLGRSHC
jgi:hypothetical protein